MTRYLLDTNIISDVVKRPSGTTARRLDAHGLQSCTSIVVLAELRFWLVKGSSDQRRERLELVLDPLEILPLDAPVDLAYARLRAQLEAAGTPIGANDLLIASQAIALGLTVVTDNEREFRRVPRLAVENWLRE